MKNSTKLSSALLFTGLFFLSGLLLSLGSYAQSTLIDSKSLNLPRYANLSAITSTITAPQQGMMVYNSGTATNWYYNGSTWLNLATATAALAEAEGFGSWGCNNAAVKAYQPVGNEDGRSLEYFGDAVSISGDFAIVGATWDEEGGFLGTGSATIYKRNASTGIWEHKGSKLTNATPEEYDKFGSSVSISGDYAIVGAPADEEGGMTESGSATIFRRNASTGVWEPQGGKLTNSSPASADYFGWSVSISGDYAIVGAYRDDEGGFIDTGSATIYRRNTSTGVWEPQGIKLTNPSPANYDYFGESVSISGDYAIVGAKGDKEGGFAYGSATIFKRNVTSGVWEPQGSKLMNPSPADADYFGESVSISGYYAVVGTPTDSEGGFIRNGSATIFKRNASTGVWEPQGSKLTNPNPANDDYFGGSVSISGNYAIVGTSSDNEGGFTSNGSVTIYRRYGGLWRALAKITDPNARSNDYFGNSVAIDGTTARFLIGSYGVSTYQGLAVFGQVK